MDSTRQLSQFPHIGILGSRSVRGQGYEISRPKPINFVLEDKDEAVKMVVKAEVLRDFNKKRYKNLKFPIFVFFLFFLGFC